LKNTLKFSVITPVL